MKVVKVGSEDAPYLTKEELEKIAILKLVGNGEFIEGVGIKDGQFYVLAEDEDDQMYLAWTKSADRYTGYYPTIAKYMKKGLEIGFLKEACEREMGQSSSGEDTQGR